MKERKRTMRIESRIMQAAENKVGVIYIYDEISNDTYDWWSGQVIKSETSEKFIRDRLAELEGVTELEIHISSCGGSVKVAMGLYSQIKAFACPKKVSYIDGMAASAATVIAMAADEVVMPMAALMMIHDAWMSGVSGNSAELRKAADDLDVITSASVTAYLQHSNGKISEEELKALMKSEAWLTAKQCLEYGLCDRISDEAEGASGEALQSVRNPILSGAVFGASRLLSLEARVLAIEERFAALAASGDDDGEGGTVGEDGGSDDGGGDTAHINITPAMNRADIISALCYALIAKGED